jgi:hypothetical protein
MIKIEFTRGQTRVSTDEGVVLVQPMRLDGTLEQLQEEAARVIACVDALVAETTRQAWYRETVERTDGFHR